MSALVTAPSVEALEYLALLHHEALTTAELKDLPPVQWLIDGLLQEDSMVETYGRTGTFKTFIAMDWALCIRHGLDWCGQAVDPEGRVVLYIASEGAYGLGDRVTAWEEFKEDRLKGRAPGGGERGRLIWHRLATNLGSPDWAIALGQYAHAIEADLVVFDTRARNTVGAEENSAKELGLVVERLDQIRLRSGATVLLLHHTGASGERGRGSTAVEGAAETEISVAKDSGSDDLVKVRVEKQRNGPDGHGWGLRRTLVADSMVLAPVGAGPGGPGGLATDEEAVSTAGWEMLIALQAIYIDDPISWSRWMKSVATVSEATFGRQLKVLIAAGHVEKSGRGYVPTETEPKLPSPS